MMREGGDDGLGGGQDGDDDNVADVLDYEEI